MEDTDRTPRELAAVQHGLVTRAQLARAATSRKAYRHELARGGWMAMGRRVLRLTGSPLTAKQELMGAVLDAGPNAVVSHEAAAALWGLPGFWPGPLDVSRPRSRNRMRPTLGELHETRRLPPTHLTTVDGIPVTNVPRTLFDLSGAPGMSDRRLARTVDNAMARSPSVLPRLHAMLDELAARGRPGIATMREVLAERPPGYVPPASGLEARVIELLAESGVTARRQLDLGGEHWIGRVDLLVDRSAVVVEADSALHHTSPSDRARDQRRDTELVAAGFTVVRVTDEEAFQRPWVVATRVLAAVRRAG